MNRNRALVAIHVSAVLFGLTGVFGELIQATAAAVTAGRAGFALLALAGFAGFTGRSLTRGLNAGNARALLAAGVMLAVHWATFFHAVKVGGIAIATLGFASFPAFITLFEIVVFRERVRASELLLLGLVTIGLVLVVPAFDWSDTGTIGLAWALLSGATFAVLALINRRAAAGIDAVQVAFWQNLLVLVLVVPFALSSFGDMRAVDWVWMALLGILCTGLSHYLFVSALSVLTARAAGLVISLEPVYAIAAAWWLFAQEPTLRMLLGAALIIFAITLSSLRKPAPHD
ncbi:DMT family transporter [Pigmentiphaga aceris]|uniref:DMT family transporter n=1 Tax=Pigmentiphaga aceris TaxID=1940612 RepID=A0A5C0B4G4_9BURK|nr:DMT family transporter [Pigmentiphaga aceris]QEI08160.1 DMT family transporter [Pigmentiphaga aceris]